jgi:hypothetical protein
VSRWWRWARFILLPLVNLPLLALAGHVAWKVVRAYLEGPYLGADYFMNATAFGLVLAAAGTLLGSLSLAGAARRARKAGELRFSLGLDALEAQLKEQAAAALAGPRRAAAQLEALASQS